MSTCECDFLELRYPIERNKRVYFNDDMNEETGIQNHDYYIDNKKIDISVTGVIHENFPHFDPEAVSEKIVKGKRWATDPSYTYYQMPQEQMIKQWKDAGTEASGLGSIMHMDIEMFYNYICFIYELHDFIQYDKQQRSAFCKDSVGVPWKEFIVKFYNECLEKNISVKMLREKLPRRTPTYDELSDFKKFTESIVTYPQHILRCFTNDSVEFKQFLNFYHKTKDSIFPYRTELIMFDDDHQLAGSIDMLFKDTEGRVLIYDWKRSKEFKYDNRWQKGFGLLSHLDDCNIIHYSLQLNMYRRILETHYGEKVAGMVLIRCHPNIETYDKYDADIMDKEISAILARRKERLLQRVASN